MDANARIKKIHHKSINSQFRGVSGVTTSGGTMNVGSSMEPTRERKILNLSSGELFGASKSSSGALKSSEILAFPSHPPSFTGYPFIFTFLMPIKAITELLSCIACCKKYSIAVTISNPISLKTACAWFPRSGFIGISRFGFAWELPPINWLKHQLRQLNSPNTLLPFDMDQSGCCNEL